MMQAILGKRTTSVGRPRDTWLEWVGRIGLYTFLFFYQLNATVSYIAMGLVTIVFFLGTGRWWVALKGDTVIRIYLGLVLYIVVYALCSAHEFPETRSAQRMAVGNWMHWLAFIPVAWIIREDKKHINAILLLLASGVMARILLHVDWSQIPAIFHWPRTGFGLAETVFAPLAGITALGFLLLAPRMTVKAPHAGRWTGLIQTGLWLAGLAIFLESLVLSQTRGVWLSAAVVFPVSLTVRYGGWLRNCAFNSAKGMAFLGLAFAIGGLLIQQNSALLINRIKSEQLQSDPMVVKKVFEGDQEVVLTTSIGYRVIMWRIGWQKWKERPFSGWGPGTTANCF